MKHDAPLPQAAADPDGGDPRDLHAIVSDGVFFSVMVGLGETYVPAFALAAGFDEVMAGLVATVPMLGGALFQLLTPWAVRRFRSYRRWVVLCAALQALSFIPLIVGALSGRVSFAWLAVATLGYWSFGMASGPAWNAWITSLVPPGIRAGFFARRARAAQGALFIAILCGGFALEQGRALGRELAFFAGLFSAALLARLVSARFLARQGESPGLALTHRTLAPSGIVASVRRARSGRLLVYLVCMQVVVNVAAPFFTPYMLGPLGLSYTEFMTLTASAFLARVMVLPLLGRVAHRRGARTVLRVGAAAIAPLPVLWLVSHQFLYLVGVQVLAGCAWAAVELATLLAFFEGIEEDERASVLSAFNLATAGAIALGAVLGSELFAFLGSSPSAYAALFAVSAGGRLLILAILRGIPVAGDHVAMDLRTLAVRPSAGAVQRPILASVEPLPDDDEAG